MWHYKVKSAAVEKEMLFYEESDYERFLKKCKADGVDYQIIKKEVSDNGSVLMVIRIPFIKYDFLKSEECLSSAEIVTSSSN